MIYAQFLQNFVNTFSANLLRLKNRLRKLFRPFGWMSTIAGGLKKTSIEWSRSAATVKWTKDQHSTSVDGAVFFLAFFNIFGSKFETQKFCVLIETAKIDKDGDGNDDEGEYKRKIHEMDSRCEKGIWSAGSEHTAAINKHNINGSQCSPSHKLITKTSMWISKRL